MKFSTRHMHIVTFEGGPDNFPSGFKALPDKDVDKLVQAVEHAISCGAMGDTVQVVTLCSDVYLTKEDLDSLLSKMKSMPDITRITALMSDLIVALTTRGFVVTIRIVGARKFVETEVTETDDSFEETADLSQRVANLTTESHPYATPRK